MSCKYLYAFLLCSNITYAQTDVKIYSPSNLPSVDELIALIEGNDEERPTNSSPTSSIPGLGKTKGWNDPALGSYSASPSNLGQEVKKATTVSVPQQVISQQAAPVSIGLMISFRRNSDSIDLGKPGTPESLQKMVSVITQVKNSNFILEGHTDSTGSSEYNKKLSLKRAEAIKRYLVNYGVSSDRLITHGVGSSKLINPNDQNDERNRRVVFTKI